MCEGNATVVANRSVGRRLTGEFVLAKIDQKAVRQRPPALITASNTSKPITMSATTQPLLG